ncbi:MAG: hypothetical protein U0326_06115 [Polyangiales bacterium]
MRDAPHRRQRRPTTSTLYLFALLGVGCDASGALGDYDDPDASAVTDARPQTPDAVTAAPDARAPRDVAPGADVSAPPRDVAMTADASAPRDVAMTVDASAPRDVAMTADASAPRDVATTVDAPTAPPTSPSPGVSVAPALGQLTTRQVPTIAPTGGLKAFPGADGFGASATGGRGGRVIFVTTLAPTGPGSLTEALEATGPRYVLFRVSGFINGSFRISQGDVTIAGQSAPGGVTVRGIHTDEATWCDSNCGAGVRGVDNIILRHIRTRPGEPGAGDELIDGDGLRIRHTRRMIADHISSENSVDENVEISYSNNITVQDSIIAEALGWHSDRGGMLMNYSNPAAGYQLDGITVARTTWIRIQGRYPEMARESPAAAGSTARIELANNLLWGQEYYIDSGHTTGTSSADGMPVYYQLNWVGNVGVARPGFSFAMMFFPNPTGRSTVYFRDDRLNTAPGRTDWALVYCCNDFPMSPAATAAPSWAVPARHDFPAVSYIPGDQVRAYAVSHAGAFPRDPMDRRLMGYVAQGVISTATAATNPANDARNTDWTTPPPVPADGDNDGMPDAWERAHGLNPAAQDHNGLTVGMSMPGMAGYTNLEVYLAELAEQRLTEGRWGA